MIRSSAWAAAAAFVCSASGARAAEISERPTNGDDVVVVYGVAPAGPLATPGSLTMVDPEEIERIAPVTVKELLRRIPGVSVVDEDALGLKLNLSVRGLSPRRSGRTLLLEDGAPIQPAPYADPSAHHYPALQRVHAIEALKGSGQVLHGPQSFGGMINFVTREAPEEPVFEAGAVTGLYGHAGADMRLGLGDVDKGVALDLVHIEAPGTRRGHDTSLVEGALNVRWSAGDHTFRVKLVAHEERSAITESGLTQARFDADPYSNPFSHDRFALERAAVQGVHVWRSSRGAVISTQLYGADTFRASYRQTDTSTDAMIANPATGCVGAARTDYEGAAAICGNKMRPRDFLFFGVESRIAFNHSLFGPVQTMTFGARLHNEETRRRRFNGSMASARENSPGTVLRDDNSIDVRAIAAFMQDRIELGDWRITPGLRVENIETVNAAGVANFIAIGRSVATESTTVLPGIGVTWAPDAGLTLFAGVHSGFAPPRPDRDINPVQPFATVEPERGVTSEIGVRAVVGERAQIEATLFQIDLEDMIVEGPLVGGRSGSFANAGKARHQGAEVSALWQFTNGFYMKGNYAGVWTAEFVSDADEFTGGVRGNRIPYSPRHNLDLVLGYAGNGPVSGELGLNHLSEQFTDGANTRTPSADGQKGIVPSRTLMRGALHLKPRGASWRAFVSVQNILDTPYISSRTDGIFTGARRQATLGVRYALRSRGQ